MAQQWFVELRIDDAVNAELHTESEPLRPPRLCVKARYNRAVLASGAHTPVYQGPVLVHRAEGVITLKAGGSEVQIPVELVLQDGDSITLRVHPGATLSVCSTPLTSEAIKTLEALKSEYILVSWSVRGIASYNVNSVVQRPPGMHLINPAFLNVTGSARLTMIDLIKGVLEPATATKRLILEIQLPITETLGTDEDMRRALTILKQKAELLEEARRALLEARDSTGYRSAIDHVRKAIEGLTLGIQHDKTQCSQYNTLCRALEKALRIEAIIDSEDLQKAETELHNTLKGLDEISKALYKLASTLGVHAKGYTPRPQREEAEIILYIATAYLKYLNDTILRAIRKT